MPYVALTDLKPGLRKVSLTKAIRKHAGLSLAQAKACTDRHLAGEQVVIALPTAAAARALAREAAEIGAVAEVSESAALQPVVA